MDEVSTVARETGVLHERHRVAKRISGYLDGRESAGRKSVTIREVRELLLEILTEA